MAARTGRPYKLQVLSTNGERKLQGSANNPTKLVPQNESVTRNHLEDPARIRHTYTGHWESRFQEIDRCLGLGSCGRELNIEVLVF